MTDDNPVRSSLVAASYDWLDPTMVNNALVSAKHNPPALTAKEVVVVAGVGAVLSLIGERIATPLVLGTGLYTLGYVAKNQGWLDQFTR